MVFPCYSSAKQRGKIRGIYEGVEEGKPDNDEAGEILTARKTFGRAFP